MASSRGRDELGEDAALARSRRAQGEAVVQEGVMDVGKQDNETSEMNEMGEAVCHRGPRSPSAVEAVLTSLGDRVSGAVTMGTHFYPWDTHGH